jgi:hypothetical protein
MLNIPGAVVEQVRASADTDFMALGIPYCRKAWQHRFPDDADVLALCRRCPDSVSRRDLEALARDVLGGACAARRLFLSAMMWGFGTVGYGAWRTQQMLNTPDFAAQLADAFRSVRDGQLDDAYRTVSLAQCGPAFLTKFLYAAGLGTGATPLPLVLDSRVAAALTHLLPYEDYGQVCRTCSGMVVHDVGAYLRYVALVDGWAHALSVRADAIEYCLFSMGSEPHAQALALPQ